MRPPGRRLNRVLLPLLRRAPGRWLGRRLAVVEYRGRRSDRPTTVVTGYAGTGSRVVITVGWPDRKTWWRNFETPHPVHLRLAGEEHDATAQVERVGAVVRVLVDLDGRRDQDT